MASVALQSGTADEAVLADWLARHVAGFRGPLSLDQIAGGQSNPTYRISTPDAAYVLRRKPLGPLLGSAHAVDREYRLLAALHPTGSPVPDGTAASSEARSAAASLPQLAQSAWEAALAAGA